MTTFFDSLVNKERLLLEAKLKPIQGKRFQPTGFADLGAAVYQLPTGDRMLLVESAQSIANRLEQTIIAPDNEIIDELKGLPYIRAKLTGSEDEIFTTSLVEAHRINSPFIISNENFKQAFSERAAYKRSMPLDWGKIAKALLYYDANSLLHGVFLANLEDGRIKVARAISGFIEAEDVREAVSGGVKNNAIDPTGTLMAADYIKDVYGNVPYQRVEYTAANITAYFNLDLGLLRSYNLGEDATELLIALAIYKVKLFLETGLRLRTACDLDMQGELYCTNAEFNLPEKEVLLDIIKNNISSCQAKGLFANPAVTKIITPTVIKAKASKSGKGQSTQAMPDESNDDEGQD